MCVWPSLKRGGQGRRSLCEVLHSTREEENPPPPQPSPGSVGDIHAVAINLNDLVFLVTQEFCP